MRWKRFGEKQLAGRLYFRSGRVINHDQMGGIEVKNLAQLFSHLHSMLAVSGREHRLVAKLDKFVGARRELYAGRARRSTKPAIRSVAI